MDLTRDDLSGRNEMKTEVRVENIRVLRVSSFPTHASLRVRSDLFLVPMLLNLLNLIIYTGLRWNAIVRRSCVERQFSFSRGA